MAGEYTIRNIYQGGYSSLKPSYGDIFTGYRASAESIGVSTDPRTANILQEVSTKIAPGQKVIELSLITPEIMESIPKQHLKEVNRLSKLAGVEVTVHGPLAEASGISDQGFSETGRKSAERQMSMAVERSHEINPNGNIPVTFHSSYAIPGPEIEKTEKGEKIKAALVINNETGKIAKIPLKERKWPGEEGEPDIKKEVAKINESTWGDTIRTLTYYADMGEKSTRGYSELMFKLAESEKEAGKPLVDAKKEAISQYNFGATYLNESYRQLKDLFELAKKYGTSEDKKILESFSKEIEENAVKIKNNPKAKENVDLMKNIIDKGVETFGKMKTVPEIYRPLNDFAMEQSTTTFANIALDSYKKFKDKAPIISIENPPAGGGFSRAEDLRNLVEESRKKFTEVAVKSKAEGGFSLSESEAKLQAEKLLGVTWDVGHINMLRKYGYEEKDIIKESEKIAPLVKHVHLSDNFGFEHTELPMGMGNVPLKEIMKKLGEKGEKAKKIVEAAHWWQHFKTSPIEQSLEALGSPIYATGGTPYWNQAIGYQQGYLGGYGAMLPQISYETFGAGFSQLPMELGGQRAGAAGSRMSGRGME